MIQIGDYFIAPLEFDYRLFIKKISQGASRNGKGKAGNEYEQTIGYFPTIPSALKRIRKLETDKILLDTTITLDEAISIIEDFDRKFEEMIKNAL